MQRLIALLGLLLPLAVNAAGGQTLGSPMAVLDALKQSRGGVLLAFIDSPADQANPVKNLQGLLSRYTLVLNSSNLGQVRRNTVLHVRPRLGINRLTIGNAFNDRQFQQLSFPAMRAAGVSTAIIEIRTSRDFTWIEAFVLSGAEVQAIENALNRSQHGGMTRVIALIRSRGRELPRRVVIPIERDSRSDEEYSTGRTGSSTEFQTLSDREGMISMPADRGSNLSNGSVDSKDSTDATVVTNERPVVESDSSREKAADASTDTEEAASGASVSADRRSYY
jgi:hypothetical protein